MNKLVFLLVVACLPVVACDDDTYVEPTKKAATTIETDNGVVLVETEVADSAEERRIGLMNRRSLADNAGMLFVFFEEHAGGFWMKDTLIPLSIAYFDDRGKILAILDMDPCTTVSCPSYYPGVPYWGALEVNQGSFEEWGVEEGDIIRSNQ
jgi:uncharacterized protein